MLSLRRAGLIDIRQHYVTACQEDPISAFMPPVDIRSLQSIPIAISALVTAEANSETPVLLRQAECHICVTHESYATAVLMPPPPH